ncbi:solute:sodium symporter family transporter [Vibrio sp. SS-MA-C1-2]|uniref:solute:sodium symporter family transporter n=1 Tax=Vibrio sp. SS-MA-C1-2 TaxID=2908646 RepID=UPI001F33CDB4|nr:solute:sodium symporter family transporter [Vibrio sp. SS-MA-C1-2]UJF18250.1 solute:sodium symporter family transporter [Vibrio sp. SS-MA-C1-2]
MFTFISAVAFMAFVAYYSWKKTKGQVDTANGYFLAGNGLTSLFIAGSLLLTNISTEQLIGQSGATYHGNLTVIAFEVWAIRGIILLACLFLPMYLGGAFSTVPSFLQSRYGESTRKMVSSLFMFGYIFVWSPTVLYGGSLALMKILNIEIWLGLSQIQALWLVTIIVGFIGAIYAVTGGLRAVAISDTLNGIGLLIIGLLVPIFGLMAASDQFNMPVIDVLHRIATTNTEKLNAIGLGAEADAIPISAVFTGLMVMATFYWATNQFVIQRALGAESLKSGQRGLLTSGFFKMIVPIIAMFPGILAFHMYGDGLSPRDIAYPTLVSDVLPAPLLGLFIAVLLGAIFSTYNSLLNSAATLFAMDIYLPLKKEKVSDEKLIRVSKIFAIICAVFTIIAAPMLLNAPDGLFIFLQKFTGFIAVPICTLVLMGLFTKKLRIPAVAANTVICFHVITYWFLVWGAKYVGIEVNIHWMHIFALLFCIEVSTLTIWALVAPAQKRSLAEYKPKVNMLPWKYAMLTSMILISLAILIFILLSPVGLAYSDAVLSPTFHTWFAPALIICVALCFVAHRYVQPKYAAYIIRNYVDRESSSDSVELNTQTSLDEDCV